MPIESMVTSTTPSMVTWTTGAPDSVPRLTSKPPSPATATSTSNQVSMNGTRSEPSIRLAVDRVAPELELGVLQGQAEAEQLGAQPAHAGVGVLQAVARLDLGHEVRQGILTEIGRGVGVEGDVAGEPAVTDGAVDEGDARADVDRIGGRG